MRRPAGLNVGEGAALRQHGVQRVLRRIGQGGDGGGEVGWQRHFGQQGEHGVVALALVLFAQVAGVGFVVAGQVLERLIGDARLEDRKVGDADQAVAAFDVGVESR